MYALLNQAYKTPPDAHTLETTYQKIIETGLKDNPIPEKTGNKGKTAQTESL